MNRRTQPDTESTELNELTDSPEERPPIFRTWRGLYFAVLGNLALLIAIFYLITRMFQSDS